MAEFSTIHERLGALAETVPSQLAFSFLATDQSEVGKTYAELNREVQLLASALARPERFQQRAMLFFPPGLDYITAFFGCLRAGLIAVPAYPPRASKHNERNLQRILTVVKDAAPLLALTTPELYEQIKGSLAQFPELEALEWVVLDGQLRQPETTPVLPQLGTDDLAFLQYTSGSTSTPKGVMVSHGNLMANEAMIQQAFGTSPMTTCVGWLPLYHDMGLIGNILQPVFAGFTCHLMAPTTFLRQPQLWLETISRTKAVISGGPNFAYELCAQKIQDPQLSGLDLSSWRVAFNGSEPIRAATLDAFAQRFEACGFKASAFFPCYGLAEATLMVSGRGASGVLMASFDEAALEANQVLPATDNEVRQRRLVGSGQLNSQEVVRIVAPGSKSLLPSTEIGEIWVAGPHIAKGYWQRPDVSAEIFEATTDSGEGPFMRTGDLGFLHEGELFITGRLKELMILRGRNLYPQDVEQTVQACDPGLQPDGGAAFTVEVAGEAQLVVVQEVVRTAMRQMDATAVIQKIRAAVAEVHEANLHAVVLLKPVSLPKTTSGKVRRGECRRLFEADELEVFGASVLSKKHNGPMVMGAPQREELCLLDPQERRAELLDYVRHLLALTLELDVADIQSDQVVTSLGLDSLAAVDLVSRLERDLGAVYALEALLDGPSVDELVDWLTEEVLSAPVVLSQNEGSVREGALSYNQTALWLLHELMPESTAYHIPLALRVLSPISPEKLGQALAHVVARHPALRTVFENRAGEPAQRVLPSGPRLEVIDALSWSPAQLAQELDRQAQKPFELGKSAWRLQLYQRPGSDSVLLLVAHHLVTDLWSILIFFRELGEAYRDSSQLPAAPVATYADFVRNQALRLAAKPGQDLLQYWQKQFADRPAVLTLPTDRPRPPIQSHNGAAFDFQLELGQELRTFAAARGVTAFTVLLAGWQILLQRYSGQTDICVGSPVAGRLSPDFVAVIGDFVNPVVFRGDLTGNPSFGDYLNQVTATVRAGLGQQELPFELLVERVCPSRDPSYSPLFQTMFSLQKPHRLNDASAFILADREASLELGGLTVAPVALPQRSAQVDLALVVVDDDHLAARLVYNTDLFDPASASRFAQHLHNLLRVVLTQPTVRIEDVDLMEQAELNHLLTVWNDTSAAYADDRCLHELLGETARRMPERTALVFDQPGQESVRLSYGELETQAERVAAQLRQRGVGPDCLVGVCVSRKPELVVALLAVLKAGGAYVPLDPTHPAARVQMIVEDSGLKILICETLDQIDLATAGCEQILLSQLLENETVSLTSPALVDPSNLAYVIFTSGSTGRPKGVQLCHRTVVNFLQSIAANPGMDASDVLLAVTTISFDIAGLELYVPLLVGATLVLASSQEVSDGVALVANLKRNQVTVMQATPSTWRLLLDAQWQGPLKALCGGEALPGKLAQDLLASGVSLWNMYGPTETTIWSAVGQVHEASAGTRAEAIGLPIANTSLYVLDRHARPVPLGVAGELYIGGEGLARGYDKRPGLTATSFVPDPYGDKGSRRYRTGDLVRYLADGRIEFLGRIDYQVKLRGFRIEVGEIEAALGKHPGLREAVIALRGKTEESRALVAYVTLSPGSDLAALRAEPVALAANLRGYLRQDLPEYMIPSYYVVMEALPLTPNNKVDRKALPEPTQLKPAPSRAVNLSGLEATIAEVWREFLNVAQVGPNDNFFDLGGHSLLLSKVNNRLKERLNLNMSMVEMFQYPTISTLANFIRKQDTTVVAVPTRTMDPSEPIAIIGMACRVPGADDIQSFWENLKAGVCSIITYSEQSLRDANVPDALLSNPQYVRAGGFLADSELFDARFFDLSPLDASLIDPQQRLFLEVCWHALEGASFNPDRYTGAVGVFAGSGMNTYLSNNLLTNPELVATEGDYRLMTTNDKDFMATRVAYKLNLRGPAINLQTACSTSLVAVHQACQSLRAGECDMALAGGVTVRVPGNVGYLYRDGLVFSPDGVCRAFDKQAGGTVAGNGAAVVLLKGLASAQADGDEVIAVIKGSAINNDASQKVGFTAPGVDGQRAVILAAQASAGVNPETITYVEAHGTGTKMGDPIEVAALTAAFRSQTSKTAYCALGSVKTNIGHLDTAAGVAGLIKVALSLKHATLPASLNYREPNPEIDFAASPFFVNAETRLWDVEPGQKRRAAISSFGIGGTNAHAILEEAPAPLETKLTSSANPAQASLVFLSARSAPALEALSSAYAGLLTAQADQNLGEIALKMANRKAFEHRRFLIAGTPAEAAEILSSEDPKRLFSRREELSDRPVAFLFPGQGAQYPFMTAQLYAQEPRFAKVLDDCCQRLLPLLGCDLRSLLYPSEGSEADAALRLRQTEITQPALFVVEYALAQHLLGLGFQPRALMGHSVGEYVAATLAGVFSLDDALALIAQRGKLIASLPEGSMISIPLSEADVLPLLGEGLSLAAVNAPTLCVASGPSAQIEALSERLANRKVAAVGLRTSHAFHSSMMDPILAQFEAFVRSKTLNPPSAALISNLTGTWMTAEQATDPGYWVSHLREAVRFADGVTTLFSDPSLLVLEVGPGRTLTGLARRQSERGSNRVLLNLLPPADQRETEAQFFNEALGKLWLSGVAFNLQALYPGQTVSSLALPAYPFQRQRFWIEPGKGTASAVVTKSQRAELEEWFYLPSWKRADRPRQTGTSLEPGCWLVFMDRLGVGERLAALLRQQSQQVVVVATGSRFERVGEDRYTLQPEKPEDYQELLNVLTGSGRDPRYLVYLNALSSSGESQSAEAGFHQLLYLSRAIAALDDKPRTLVAVTNGAQDPIGTGIAHPEQSLLMGLLKVLPQEHKSITCHGLDFAVELAPEQAAQQIYAELSGGSEPLVAFRGRTRWLPTIEPASLRSEADGSAVAYLREGGTYLITGGLGGVGLAIAEHLGKEYKANLVLLGRSAVPARSDWDQPTQAQNPLVQRLKALELAGAQVLALAADVSDETALKAVLERARERFGVVTGVIHAAGVPGGGAIAHRTVEDIAKVFAAKVQGTQALAKAFASHPPEFLALFSSVNALLGGFGQADYAAANAFQDAFSLSNLNGPTHIVSINWDSWRDVGMAAAALNQAAGKSPSGATVDPVGQPVAHPLFDRKLADEGLVATYLTYFAVDEHWPLNEHWILDRAILPGTTYLEMARAALEDHAGQEAVTFRDVSFLAPLVVAVGERRAARTVLTRKDGFFSFQIASRQDDGSWREHAMGQLYPLSETPRQFNVAEIIAQHDQEILEKPLSQNSLGEFHLAKATREVGNGVSVPLTVITDGKEPPEVSIELGQRWHSVSQVRLGAQSGLAKMELDPHLSSDFPHYKLHPAILDFAVGFLRLFKNQASFLPLSYNRLHYFGPLDGKLYSHIAFAAGYKEDRGNPIFDISLFSEDGKEVAKIEGFALGKIDKARLDSEERALADKRAEVEAFTQFWMKPDEGVDAFKRALGSGLNRVVVSTRDFNHRLVESLTVSSDVAGALHGKGFDRPVHPRPDLMNPYVAPRNEQETKLSDIWKEVIGLEQVGIHDDFNDLGGDSLLITRIHARMKEVFTTELSVAELMQYPNIADLSSYMNRQNQTTGAEAQKADRQIRMDRQAQAKKVQDKLKQARSRNPMSRSRK